MDSAFHIASLCAGGGGLDRGIHRAVGDARTVVFVEREGYACEVLAAQMDAGLLAPAPLWTDLRTFDGRPWRGRVHCVAAGYPCQPFSLAGKRLGAADPRHLWPDVARIVREIVPEWVFLENVAGHVSKGLRDVAGELQAMGYRVAAGLFRASDVGASHERERLFILAHSGGDSLREQPERCERHASQCGHPVAGELVAPLAHATGHRRGEGADAALGRRTLAAGGVEDVADTDRAGRVGLGLRGLREDVVAHARPHAHGCGGAWLETLPPPPGKDDAEGWREYLRRWPGLEPAVRRGADGLAHRVDRLRLLGNGVHPEQAEYAFRWLCEQLCAESS